MPENEKQDGQVQETGTMNSVETKMEKFERERHTRRQALKKMGLTTGMAFYAMFGVDALANMVGKAMQQRAGDNKVAEQIAREFQQAGIAMATNPSSSGSTCQHCCNQYCYDLAGAMGSYCYCQNHNGTGCKSVYNTDINNTNYSYNTCVAKNCNPSNLNVCICETSPPSGCNPP